MPLLQKNSGQCHGQSGRYQSHALYGIQTACCNTHGLGGCHYLWLDYGLTVKIRDLTSTLVIESELPTRSSLKSPKIMFFMLKFVA